MSYPSNCFAFIDRMNTELALLILFKKFDLFPRVRLDETQHMKFQATTRRCRWTLGNMRDLGVQRLVAYCLNPSVGTRA